MFIRYYIELPLPVAEVEQELVGSPAGWLSAVAGAAQARGDEFLGAVGVGPWAGIGPGWPSAPTTGHRWAPSVRPSTGSWCTGAEATVKDFLDRVGAAIPDQATNADIQAVGHEGGVEAHAP